jgi:hypothetical protein
MLDGEFRLSIKIGKYDIKYNIESIIKYFRNLLTLNLLEILRSIIGTRFVRNKNVFEIEYIFELV